MYRPARSPSVSSALGSRRSRFDGKAEPVRKLELSTPRSNLNRFLPLPYYQKIYYRIHHMEYTLGIIFYRKDIYKDTECWPLFHGGPARRLHTRYRYLSQVTSTTLGQVQNRKLSGGLEFFCLVLVVIEGGEASCSAARLLERHDDEWNQYTIAVHVCECIAVTCPLVMHLLHHRGKSNGKICTTNCTRLYC